MFKSLILPVMLVLSVSACNMKTYTRAEAPMLFAALDSQPNGYVGAIGNDAVFQINATKASKTLLCRSVTVTENEGKSSRQYCKIKGGEWR